MNTTITSKAAILTAGREFVAEHGLAALNMRGLAQKCGVSVGSLYNYFPSKTELTTAVIAEIWRSIFHSGGNEPASGAFPDCVAARVENIRTGIARYPDFFAAHSLRFTGGEKDEARQVMETYFSHMRAGLLDALRKDPACSPAAFSGALGEEAFVDFVFSNLLLLLVEQKPSCDTLTQVIRRVIY